MNRQLPGFCVGERPMSDKKAVIIGAGPAGLTAAWEFTHRTDVEPLVLERSDYMGGIAKTVNYKGNRIDIGGHRFFSKSDRVMEWWLAIMPLEEAAADDAFSITYQNKTRQIEPGSSGPDPEKEDVVMLVRERTSRIYYLRKFFSYPISLSVTTLTNLGLVRTIKVGFSYIRSVLFPIRNPTTSKSSSSTASGASSISRSSRTTPRRSGARAVETSAPSGVPSASRGCRSPRP